MAKLGRHISQTSPIDQETSVALNASGAVFRQTIYDFFHAAYSLIDIRRHAAGNIGLNSAQFSVLSMVEALAPKSTPSEIAKALHVTNAFVTIEAGKLQAKGYIEKQTNPRDARSVLLVPTELGRKMFQQAYAELQRSNAVLFADFSPSEFEMLGALLGKLGVNAEEVLPSRSGIGGIDQIEVA